VTAALSTALLANKGCCIWYDEPQLLKASRAQAGAGLASATVLAPQDIEKRLGGSVGALDPNNLTKGAAPRVAPAVVRAFALIERRALGRSRGVHEERHVRGTQA
jgi:hypothetical protein